MSESATLPNATTLPDSKWVPGISGDQLVGEVACRVLEVRLDAVWHWLPRAAEQGEADVEYVHRLRVATRRAQAAVRAFRELLPEGAAHDLSLLLRRIRSAADEARDWDVLQQRFLSRADDVRSGSVGWILERIRTERRQVQPRLLGIYRGLAATELVEQFRRLVRNLPSQEDSRARRKFGREAQRYLKPVIKRFLGAAGSDLATDRSLHELRLRAKKLRYTMEIVAVAFEPAFRETLYPRLSVIQNLLGAIHDQAAAQLVIRGWLATAPEPEHREFLDGLLSALARAHEDLRTAFLTEWTPASFAGLQREFRVYCDFKKTRTLG